jgi:hypothetical protein
VIPCTLASFTEIAAVAPQPEIRIVFAGGTGKWQSLHLLDQYLLNVFERNPDVRLLMFTRSLPDDLQLKQRFPDRVEQRWVSEDKIIHELSRCDYGWMVREQTVTNQVASPVKFAEYLSAGLSVLVSEQLGDFSQFVQEHRCGVVLSGRLEEKLNPLTESERSHNRQLALSYFTKNTYRSKYEEVIR